MVGPEGQPVKSFAVCAVPRIADPLNLARNAIELAVIDAGGRFKLGLDRDGPTWVGIRAPGYQNLEMVTDVPRRGGSVVARLAPGVRVAGKIIAPAVGASRRSKRGLSLVAIDLMAGNLVSTRKPWNG